MGANKKPPKMEIDFMKQVDYEINENIYNIYNNKMLKRRPQYMYIFWWNDANPYEITKVDYDKLEEFYDMNRNRIFTMGTKLDDLIKEAEDQILESLCDNTGNLTGDVEEEIELAFELDNYKANELYSIDYRYNPFMQGVYQKQMHYHQYIKNEE